MLFLAHGKYKIEWWMFITTTVRRMEPCHTARFGWGTTGIRRINMAGMHTIANSKTTLHFGY